MTIAGGEFRHASNQHTNSRHAAHEQLMNARGHMIKCSHFQPAEEEEEEGSDDAEFLDATGPTSGARFRKATLTFPLNPSNCKEILDRTENRENQQAEKTVIPLHGLLPRECRFTV